MANSVFVITSFNFDHSVVTKARSMKEAIAAGWAARLANKEDDVHRYRAFERSFWIEEVEEGGSIELTENPCSEYSWKKKVPVSQIDWYFQEPDSPASKAAVAAAFLLDNQVKAAKSIQELAMDYKWEWRKEERRAGETLAMLAEDFEDFLWSWADWDEKAQKWVFYHNED